MESLSFQSRTDAFLKIYREEGDEDHHQLFDIDEGRESVVSFKKLVCFRIINWIMIDRNISHRRQRVAPSLSLSFSDGLDDVSYLDIKNISTHEIWKEDRLAPFYELVSEGRQQR